MLLHSVAGSFRGGHSHDCAEVVMVLSGRMRYYKKWKNGEKQEVLFGGTESFNPAGEVHMGEFLEDTWLIEYKLAPKGSWQQEDFEPYRKKVRESIKA